MPASPSAPAAITRTERINASQRSGRRTARFDGADGAVTVVIGPPNDRLYLGNDLPSLVLRGFPRRERRRHVLDAVDEVRRQMGGLPVHLDVRQELEQVLEHDLDL